MHHPPAIPTSANVPDLAMTLPTFKNKVSASIREAWEEEDARAHFQSLASGLKEVVSILAAIGDAAAQGITKQTTDFSSWYITYEWMENAKSFTLLWRDVLFQEQRAWLKMAAGEVSQVKFEQLQHSSKQVITDAAATLVADLESVGTHPLNNVKQLEKWALQEVPWRVYKEQLERLPEQVGQLVRQSENLWNASGTFVLLGSHFTETYDYWLSQIAKLKKGLEQFLKEVSETENLDSDGMTAKLEQIDEHWEKPDNTEIFLAHLDDYISRLPAKEKIFAAVDGGLLLYKELNLKSEVRAWVESELLTEVYELFTIRDGITNKIHLNMLGVRNLLLQDDESQQLSDRESIIQIFTNFLKSLNRSESRTQQLRTLTQQKLQKEFTLSNIYKNNFLARPLQYTINQYRDSARWNDIQNWIKKQAARIIQLQQNVLAEESLSISERIVRVVNSRQPEADNSHYTNMFLTKGWIGDSFVVGLETELARVSDMVENWKQGYRGAVMVTGKRFSGKTLFGELIDQRFFENKSVKITPNSRLVLPGKKNRQLDIDCDLDAALRFITRYGRDRQIMIWIDDLELWQSNEVTLAENVSSLLNFIDIYSGRLFFVVAMSNWLKARLATAFDIDRVFQIEINLSYMSTAGIREAILVRHSATHTVLFNSENEEMTASELTRIINRIAQVAEGNIGEALQRWAYTVKKIGDEKIKLLPTSLHKLPPFLSMESALILQSVLMEKKSSEKRLRQLFGPAYAKSYERIVKRMLHLGLLKKEQGMLSVNRYLANEVGKLLSQKTDFKYDYDMVSKKQIRI